MNDPQTRRCLVTGGSGFVGTHLLRALLERDLYDEILVVDLVPPAVEDDRIRFVAADIREPLSVDIEGAVSDLFHLAAVCKEPGFPRAEYYRTNYIGTRRVCELAAQLGVSNLIFTGTMMSFEAGDQRYVESDLTTPDTDYGTSKLLGEWVCRAWQQAAPGRRLRLLRASVIFGEGENGNFTRLYYALKKKRFAFIGRRTTVKSWIYVKDLVGVLLFFAADEGERTLYNIAYPEETTIGEICAAMREALGVGGRIPVVPYRLALLLSYGFVVLSPLRPTGIHPRRIQKLYNSTNIAADAMVEAGFKPAFDLGAALRDWRDECLPDDLR